MYITSKLKRELVFKINLETLYPVNYVISQDRTKIYKRTMLKGADLTEKQIIQFHLEEEI